MLRIFTAASNGPLAEVPNEHDGCAHPGDGMKPTRHLLNVDAGIPLQCIDLRHIFPRANVDLSVCLKNCRTYDN
jgi:hypothetical protein